MGVNENIIYVKSNIDIFIDIIKVFSIIIFTYYTNFKLTNQKVTIKIKNIVLMIIIAIVYVVIKKEVNYLIGIIALVTAVSLIFSTQNVGKAILITTISLSINYILSIISIIMNYFFVKKNLNIDNDCFHLFTISFLHAIILVLLFKIKKLKYGITFLRKNNENEYVDIVVLNVCIMIFIAVIIVVNSNIIVALDATLVMVLSFFIMFITIQKSLQLYYKQKLLEQELSRTKEELENKNKEIEELEAENIKISKKAHTLDHKQKALSYKIEEMMKTEISKDEVAEVRERLNKIGKELYTEKTVTELVLTEISEIDNMLKFMQSECSKNKIDFELQVKGNIHYMINNFVSKEDFETLLADHIKNAIIAINHSENINRSILVKIGKFEEVYAVSIYDSGIEFEKQTLNDLGKKPNTTHADEGGTGMGFMNTFDTLRKCKASLIIEEINKPSKENYTKAIIIKFDNKNQFEIKSYRK